MNETTKTIVQLLEQGKPELQVAAAQILGELRAKEPAAVRALADGLARSPVLGRFCLDALGKIGSAPALATVARAIVEHESLSEHAAHLLGELGPQTHGVLAEIYPQAVGEQRVRILVVLAREFSPTSLRVFVKALLTPDLTATAATLLQERAHVFPAASVRLLRDGLAAHFQDALPESCLVHSLGVLAQIDPNGSKALFLRFISLETPAGVRSAAFRALRGTKLTATQVRTMTELLEDAKQKDVHEAVREVLLSLPELPEGLVASWKRLLAARQPEQRLFAARMLRHVGGAEMARVFLKLLQSDDPRFRVAAREGLEHNKQAIEPLLKLLQSTKDVPLARECASILVRLQEHLTPKLLRAIAERAVKLLSGNARMGDLLLDLVLSAGGAKIAPFVIERAVRLRRAHKQSASLHVLAKVASLVGGDEAHYQIALTKLLGAEEATPSESAAPGNSTMGFFAALVRNEFPLLDRLRTESAVTAEMLLRVGSHFAAAVGPERRFGTAVLQHLAARTKGRAGDEARLALRTAGA